MPNEHYRARERRSVRLAARIGSADEGWERPARVVDLGLGGACVEVSEAVSTGLLLDLAVDAPTLWDPLLLQARVAWLRLPEHEGGPTKLGVAFELGPAPPLFALVELLHVGAFD